MNVRQTVEELLAATAYKAGLDARIERLRAQIAEEARRRYDEEASIPKWSPDGGTVRLDVPDEKPVVVDDDAWLAYVREVSPDDVVTSYRVRENVLGTIAARCRRVNGDNLGDPVTGEIIPGVEFRKSPPRLVVTLDPSRKKQAVAEALEDVESDEA